MTDKELDELARLDNAILKLGDKYMDHELWRASAWVQSSMYDNRCKKDVKKALGKVGLW